MARYWCAGALAVATAASSWTRLRDSLHDEVVAAMPEVMAYRCASSRSRVSKTLAIGTHVGWMGHDNIGDDIMPPTFSAFLAAALTQEFPHLTFNAEFTSCDQPHTGKANYYAKHFWVLGGG